MKKTLYLAIIFTFITAPAAPVALADSQSDFSKTEQQLQSSATKVNSLADEIRLIDATTDAKAKYLDDLSRQADEARSRLAAVNRDLAHMQDQQHQAQLQLGRYVRAEYVQPEPDEFSVIASPNSLVENLSSAFYLSDLQQYVDEILKTLTKVGKQITKQQQKAQNEISKLDKLESATGQQVADLAALRSNKEQLLASTQGQEDQFRQQFEAAKAQLEAEGKFARTARQLIGSRVWDDSGFYFNQLDSRWIDTKLGWSDSSTIGDFGCGLTSLAMVFKYYGISTNPAVLNGTLKQRGAFVDDLLDWRRVAPAADGRLALVNNPYPVGPGNVDWGLIDQQLAAGNPVIVYIVRGGDIGHYVVLVNQQGGDYIMHDPIEGPFLRFNSYYSRGAVQQYITFRRSLDRDFTSPDLDLSDTAPDLDLSDTAPKIPLSGSFSWELP